MVISASERQNLLCERKRLKWLVAKNRRQRFSNPLYKAGYIGAQIGAEIASGFISAAKKFGITLNYNSQEHKQAWRQYWLGYRDWRLEHSRGI